MTRRRALAIVVTATVVPRLLVAAAERDDLITGLTEKSDRFAQTLVASGTFGFIPGRASAYTQPLYAFLLSGVYWVGGRSWLTLATAHIVLAVITALLVLAIGTRVASRRVGVTAALLATLHPYVVWHDVHINREVLDGTLAAALTLSALIAAERRSYRLAGATGVLSGLAILGNARLALLPLAIAVYVAWRERPTTRALAVVAVVLVGTSAVVAPWAVRNHFSVGCFALTTDSRALWKANNPATRQILSAGKWIDNVPELPNAPPWPELAADLTRSGTVTTVDECEQMRFYQDEVTDFWRENPGEKARLAAQAVGMLWGPVVTVESGTPQAGLGGIARRFLEPAFTLTLYVLALFGLFRLPRRYLALTLLLLAYGTLAAMVFAGTVRYRVPWDFLLCVPAALTLARIGTASVFRRRRADGTT